MKTDLNASLLNVVRLAQDTACIQSMRFMQIAGAEVCLTQKAFTLFEEGPVRLDRTKSTHPAGRVLLDSLRQAHKNAKEHRHYALHGFLSASENLHTYYTGCFVRFLGEGLEKLATSMKVPLILHMERDGQIPFHQRQDIHLVLGSKYEKEDGKISAAVKDYDHRIHIASITEFPSYKPAFVLNYPLGNAPKPIVIEANPDGIFFTSTQCNTICRLMRETIRPIFKEAASNGLKDGPVGTR